MMTDSAFTRYQAAAESSLAGRLVRAGLNGSDSSTGSRVKLHDN